MRSLRDSEENPGKMTGHGRRRSQVRCKSPEPSWEYILAFATTHGQQLRAVNVQRFNEWPPTPELELKPVETRNICSRLADNDLKTEPHFINFSNPDILILPMDGELNTVNSNFFPDSSPDSFDPDVARGKSAMLITSASYNSVIDVISGNFATNNPSRPYGLVILLTMFIYILQYTPKKERKEIEAESQNRASNYNILSIVSCKKRRQSSLTLYMATELNSSLFLQTSDVSRDPMPNSS